jgi:hypothetical protein
MKKSGICLAMFFCRLFFEFSGALANSAPKWRCHLTSYPAEVDKIATMFAMRRVRKVQKSLSPDANGYPQTSARLIDR